MAKDSTSGLSPQPKIRSTRPMRIASSMVFACGLILFFDIGGELHAAFLYPDSLSLLVVMHLGLELVASVALAAAFLIIRHEIRLIERMRHGSNQKLFALREDFDGLVQQKFAEWKLTRSEADIALLTLRGLKISDIAQARQTQVGTIKSQLSTIFRKSGTSTRTEFVASFIDEFLDFAATPQGGQSRQDQPAASTALTMSATT
jgi:DNA-binding CsgD family transcriptional regulator